MRDWRVRKGGILEQDVDRLSGEPASLAAEKERSGLSQRRGDGWSRAIMNNAGSTRIMGSSLWPALRGH